MSLPASTALQSLAEGGPGLRFETPVGDTRIAAFVVRLAGQLHAWQNRCPHRGTDLDWMPGEFFDDEGRHLVCATHGALFAPDSGLCVAGPCKGQSLQPAVLPNDGTVTR